MDNEAPEFLTWQSADRSKTVRFTHDVIRKINVEIMRGFGVTRRRGTEPGGVLLGHMDDEALVVDGFEVVPCEYAFGPSYVLSPQEEPLFAEAVGNAGHRAIGFFRSHTRDGLTLAQTDVDLIARHLNSGGRLALVLKPFATKPPAASLFFPDRGGRLHAGESPHEFPFSTKVDSVVAEPDPEPPLPPAPGPSAPAATAAAKAPATRTVADQKVLNGVLGLRGPIPTGTVESVPEARAGEHVRRRGGFLTVVSAVLFTAMALIAGFIAGVQMTGGRVTLAPPALVHPDPAAGFSLGLKAESAGERVRLIWSKQSLAVGEATGGTLYIQEGSDTRVIPLRPEEVKDGSVLHLPQEAVVRFRLELNLRGDRSVSEVVEWKR